MGNGSGKEKRSKLTRKDIDFLMRETNFKEDAIKEWYYGFSKDCPSGQLDKARFISMYSQVFPSGKADEFSKHVFRTFDRDNNGTIDFREFLLALHITSNGTPKDKLEWAFRMYDIDGNGAIDFEEMKGVIRGVYQMLGHDDLGQAEKVFARMDGNSDGLVTEAEFMKACLGDSQLMGLIAPSITL